MAGNKSYMLLCPIARALDKVGDRWTLLILRDLFAGPARFSDLQSGLKGIASNLLASRLTHLVEDGLVFRRTNELGLELYQLTELGQSSNRLLFELAAFGGLFAVGEELKRPSNLKTIVVTLQTALERLAPPEEDFTAALIVDEEQFEIIAKGGKIKVYYRMAQDPDVIAKTSYTDLLEVSEGAMTPDYFAEAHLEINPINPKKFEIVGKYMIGAIQEISKAVYIER